MTIHLFSKGTEDIFYCNIEGDIIIHYYLMCEVDEEGNVIQAISFAYGGDDSYFLLGEEDILKNNVKTLEDAKKFKVASVASASRDDECRLSNIMKVSEDNPFFTEWMAYHRRIFYWLYDRNDNDK
jgi:hypothetical protein